MGIKNHQAEKINLEKYIGEKWYEIASFPAWFEKGCSDTQAQYTDKGKYIEVKNTCIKKGKLSERIGKAFKTEKENTLKVQFFPLIKAPYKIEFVDTEYNHAVVGSGKNYLWLLSRKKDISDAEYTELTEIAKEKGYDITKLKRQN